MDCTIQEFLDCVACNMITIYFCKNWKRLQEAEKIYVGPVADLKGDDKIWYEDDGEDLYFDMDDLEIHNVTVEDGHICIKVSFRPL